MGAHPPLPWIVLCREQVSSQWKFLTRSGRPTIERADAALHLQRDPASVALQAAKLSRPERIYRLSRAYWLAPKKPSRSAR